MRQLSLFEEAPAPELVSTVAALFPTVDTIQIPEGEEAGETLSMWLHTTKNPQAKHVRPLLDKALAQLPEDRARYEDIRTLKVRLTQAGWDDASLLRSSLTLKTNHILHDLRMIRDCETWLGISQADPTRSEAR